MKLKFVFPTTVLALLLVSLFIIYSCKKEKINLPPTVSIQNLSNGTSITLGSEITCSIVAQDLDGSISSVILLIDGVSKMNSSIRPYTYKWNTEGEESGEHILRATATDDEGLSASVQITVNIGEFPMVDFSSNKTNDTVPMVVHFTDESTNDPAIWLWNFGDGTTSAEQNPTHTYADTGSFTVSLTCSNNYGSATETKENYIIAGTVVKADFAASDTNGLVPLTVSFTDQSTSKPTSWQWDFGDGETSNEQNPSHTFTDVGLYTVKLTATNLYGSDIEIKNNYIKGGAMPVAEFSTNLTIGIAPLTIEFTDLSTQNPDSWLWDFGDGGTSTEQNPSYVYNTSGTYTITLTATNEYGNNSITKTDLIIVGDLPSAEFSANSNEGVAPFTVVFSDESSSNTTSWLWDFGDGGSSTEQHPSYTFTTAGKYDVSLTATNQYGSHTETKTEYIHVLAVAPEISIVDIDAESDWDYWVVGKEDYYYVKSENDIPQSVLFHSSQANKDYTGFFTDEGNLDKLVIDDHIFVFKNFNGTKVDIGILYPNGEIEILREVETGYTWPALSLKSTHASETWNDLIGTTANLVAGIPCMLTAVQAQSTVGLASGILEWTCENELLNLSINLAAQEIILHDSSGSFVNLYDINTTALSCGSSDPIACISDIAAAASQFLAMQQALVETRGDILEETEIEMLTPIAEFTADKTTGSAPVSITFTDLSTQNPNVWAWDFGDGASSSEQNPVHTYQQPGVYSVSLSVTNEYGTDDAVKTNYVTLVNIPIANFTANKTSGAIPLTVTFSDLSTNNPNRWEWDFGDGGSSIAKNPTHIYTAAGNFTVTLKARNDYGSDTKTKTNFITTGTAPVATFTTTLTSGSAPLTVNFTDQSTNNPTSWTWNFGDGNTSNVQHATHTYVMAGTYSVSLVATNEFGTDIKSKSNHISVTSSGNNETGTVADIDGNIYKTVKIGDQWWMAENLATTKYNDGTSIINNTNKVLWSNNILPNPIAGYAWYDNQIVNKELYGALYSWYVIDTRKLCPSGWHVPSDYEFKMLEMFIGMEQVESNKTGYRGTNEAQKLKSISGWQEDSGSDDYGFNAYPAGGIGTIGFTNKGVYAFFWTSTEANDFNNTVAWKRHVNYSWGGISREFASKALGYSVRCVKGESIIGDPPRTNFVANVTNGVAPLTVNFADLSTNNPDSWLWDFGDGSTSNIQNPSHTYTSSGVYTVKLTSNNAYGDNTHTKDNYINSESKPTADFTASPTTGVDNLTVSFTDQSLKNPTSWFWSFGDGNSSELQNPIHVYSRPGIYNVYLGVANNNGSDSETKSNFINVSASITDPVAGTFIDSRDGNIYNTITIGSQNWMAENLAYLPDVNRTNSDPNYNPHYWVYGYEGNSVDEAKETSNYKTYGVLYNWVAATGNTTSSFNVPSGVKGVCPDGWHLPSENEWNTLMSYLGEQFVAGGMLKEVGTTHWENPNTGATNSSGFTALPGGTCSLDSSPVFSGINRKAQFWSSSGYAITALSKMLGSESGILYGVGEFSKSGLSIRCVKD